MGMPFLSVVIANYNYGRFIESAIRSVFEQDCFENCELIVVDGKSTDDSVSVIRRYADKLAWWCSEEDNGQSAAFNKGFRHAKGRFLTWLNADDIMMPNAVKKLRDASASNPNCQWFTGGTIWLNPEGRPFRCVKARPFSSFLLEHGHLPVWGPSSFFSRKVYEKTFGFREDYHYMMDTDLWFRFHYEQGLTYSLLPDYIWGLRVHPDAKTSGYRFKKSDMHDANSPKRLAQKQESDDMRARYPTKPMTLVEKLMHFGWRYRGREIVDLMRLRMYGVSAI